MKIYTDESINKLIDEWMPDWIKRFVAYQKWEESGNGKYNCN